MTIDLILHNGKFHTVDAQTPQAEAVAVRGDRIYAIGRSANMLNLASAQTDVIDLNGRTVTPGLTDAHVHFKNFAIGLSLCNLMASADVQMALSNIAAYAAERAPGSWIRGMGWSQDTWPGRAFPTAAQLDAIVPDYPVYLRHKSGHAAWVNSLALQIAGVDANTDDPEGGQIQRDERGRPTGILFETAMQLVAQRIPDDTEAEIVAAMRKAQAVCWSVGLVGLHDFDGRDCFRALQTLRMADELGLRIIKNIPSQRVEFAVGVGLKSGYGDHFLRTGGVKMFADGALGPRTALMIEPYKGEPDNYGIAVLDKEEMMQVAHLAWRHQLSLTTHAIGDRAVHDVLDVYESLKSADVDKLPLTPNRIEHVQLLHPSDLNRLAELNVVASMQPIHAMTDMETAERYWGERVKYGYAIRTMLESGAIVAFGSDCPIEPIDPRLGLSAAVTRRRLDGAPSPEGWYPEQRFSMAEAVAAFTLGPAVTCAQQAHQGSTTPGKLADFTIFEHDLFNIPGEEIATTPVAGTIVGGDFKYRQF